MASPENPTDPAAVVLDLAAARPATLGEGRLVCVEGPGGSGKSTLAARIGARHPAPVVVHLDDLYDGWGGLRHVEDQLATLLEPLAAGRPGRYRRYDWHRRAYAESVTVEPGPLLVLEGVGSGASRFAALVTVLVWVWVDADLRLRRGLDRDGPALRAEWGRWMAQEDRLYEAERPAARADVLVDGTGTHPPVVR